MNFRKKTMATLLIAVFLLSTLTVVYAPPIDGTHLVAIGEAGTTDTIVVEMPAGFTLGMLESISWMYYLEAGYAPHVDIMLDVYEVDGIADEALVFEWAYNDPVGIVHHTPSLTGAWYTTFDDGTTSGPATVTDTTMAWATTQASGPLSETYSFGDAGFYFASLADWKVGLTTPLGTIDGNTLVLSLEIEIDNWIVDSEAYVKNILVNGLTEAQLGLEANVVPAIVSISVDTPSVNFGSIIDGGDSDVEEVTVTNSGNVAADMTADIGSVWYQTHLLTGPTGNLQGYAAGWDLGTISADSSQGYDLQLVVVTGIGTHSGVLVFTATPLPP